MRVEQKKNLQSAKISKNVACLFYLNRKVTNVLDKIERTINLSNYADRRARVIYNCVKSRRAISSLNLLAILCKRETANAEREREREREKERERKVRHRVGKIPVRDTNTLIAIAQHISDSQFPISSNILPMPFSLAKFPREESNRRPFNLPGRSFLKRRRKQAQRTGKRKEGEGKGEKRKGGETWGEEILQKFPFVVVPLVHLPSPCSQSRRRERCCNFIAQIASSFIFNFSRRLPLLFPSSSGFNEGEKFNGIIFVCKYAVTGAAPLVIAPLPI